MYNWDETGLYKGFVKAENKVPKVPYKDTDEYLESLSSVRKSGKDYNGILNKNVVMLDADCEPHSNNLLKIIQGENLPCLVTNREGGRGYHALFFDVNQYVQGDSTAILLACGIIVDIKAGISNGTDALKCNGIEREPIYNAIPYGNLPRYFTPIKYMDKNSQIEFWNLEEGDGRNPALFSYILTLQCNDFSKEEIRSAIRILNNYVLKTPLSEKELKTILRNDSFKNEHFFKGSTFLHDRFAAFIKSEYYIKRINNQLHIYQDGIYISEYRNIEAAMIKHLKTLNRTKRKEVLEYLELLCLDNTTVSNARKIAFRNGILDIETGSFDPFTPNIVITNKINWDYNPNAYDELMDQTLDKISCDDSSLRALLEEAVGYSFFRENKLGKAFILTGETKNGKSTYLESLQHLLGENNYSSLDLKKLDDRFSTVMLFNKLANIGDDISAEFIVDPSVFKKIVTGENIDAEYKGRDKFSFKPYAKLYFSANKIPRIGKGGEFASIKRRLIIIPFDRHFSKDDPDFDPYIGEKLKSQSAMEYLIVLGVQGLKRILENKGFSTSQKTQNAIEEYDRDNDPVLAFIRECKEEERKIENEPVALVYQWFSKFCFENGLEKEKMVKSAFSKNLLSHLPELKVERIGKERTSVYVQKP